MLPALFILAALAASLAYACIIASARYDSARDKAWAEFKPRQPLRAYRDLGEPLHGGGDTR